MNIICTICSDLIHNSENIYTTTCGHIFHFDCLNAWIERSKTCPQCRDRVTQKRMFRLYPTAPAAPIEGAADLQSKLDAVMLQIRQATSELKAKNDRILELDAECNRYSETVKTYEKRLLTSETSVAALKDQLLYAKVENKEVHKLKDENKKIKGEIEILKGLQRVLSSTADDVEQMLQGYTDVRTVATFATALKKALYESETKKSEIRNKLQATKQELASEKKKAAECQAKLLQAEENFELFARNLEKSRDTVKPVKDHDVSVIEDSWLSSGGDLRSPVSDKAVETALNQSNTSLNTLVKRIENADSPYLNLKQSNLALATLQRPSSSMPPKVKPTEFPIYKPTLKPSKTLENVTNKDFKLSILQKKETKPLVFSQDNSSKCDLDVSYDGLGGHSRLETFPISRANTWKPKSLVPKLTAKHKLKRPNVANQDIGQMLKKLKEK